MMRLLVVLCLTATGCSPQTSGASDGGGVDVAINAHGTCQGKALTAGEACVTLGDYYNCSTWEHDHCCVCGLVADKQEWICYGPHAHCGAAPSLDGGVLDDPTTQAPLFGQTCSSSSVGKSLTLQLWTGAYCCACSDGVDGRRWRCVRGSSCGPPDLGGDM